jgi:four helix bundle protein
MSNRVGFGFEFSRARAVQRHTSMTGVQSFEELICWQRANELKLGVYALTRAGAVSRDLEFRDQIRNSAAGAPRLIAEGFGRFLPREFIKYLRWANGEVQETSNHVRDGFDRGYFPKAEIERLVRLAKRASKAIAGLIRYLETCPDPRKRRKNSEGQLEESKIAEPREPREPCEPCEPCEPREPP